jgi:deoxyribodipyrimidine photo-lyase
MKYNIFWFRRDLNINDNNGLYQALKSGLKIIPIFIFDNEIIEELPVDDARVSFIYEKLLEIHDKISKFNSSLIVKK